MSERASFRHCFSVSARRAQNRGKWFSLPVYIVWPFFGMKKALAPRGRRFFKGTFVPGAGPVAAIAAKTAAEIPAAFSRAGKADFSPAEVFLFPLLCYNF